MLKIKEAIVVEGRYDKNTLSQVVDALIIPVDGFQIFKKKDTVQMLRKLAATQGLIIFTDSDGAGFVIRNHLKGVLPQDQVKHAYIPDIYGKERRKATAGKEGKLGVEGMRPEVLKEVLRWWGRKCPRSHGGRSPEATCSPPSLPAVLAARSGGKSCSISWTCRST